MAWSDAAKAAASKVRLKGASSKKSKPKPYSKGGVSSHNARKK